MEGSYTLVFQDTGVPSSCSNPTVSLPSGTLDVQRVESQLTATLGGFAFQGTLYATSDFTLLGVPGDGGTGGADGGMGGADGGTGGPESVSLTGRYIPASEEEGTLPQLTGTYVGTHTGSGSGRPQRCTVTRSFTATHQ
jgi:hypothetical protein